MYISGSYVISFHVILCSIKSFYAMLWYVKSILSHNTINFSFSVQILYGGEREVTWLPPRNWIFVPLAVQADFIRLSEKPSKPLIRPKNLRQSSSSFTSIVWSIFVWSTRQLNTMALSIVTASHTVTALGMLGTVYRLSRPWHTTVCCPSQLWCLMISIKALWSNAFVTTKADIIRPKVFSMASPHFELLS